MNNYITLDSKKYKTPAKYWTPITNKPSQVRYGLNGAVDATYGPASIYEWQGMIEGPVTAEGTGWGTIADLRTTLAKRSSLSFTDHYGTTYTVHALGPFQEKSMMNKWDSSSNKILVTVRLVV